MIFWSFWTFLSLMIYPRCIRVILRCNKICECSWFGQIYWFLIYNTSAQYQFVILWQVLQMGLPNINWSFFHLDPFSIFDQFQKSFDWCAFPYGVNSARDFGFGPSANIKIHKKYHSIVLLNVQMQPYGRCDINACVDLMN